MEILQTGTSHCQRKAFRSESNERLDSNCTSFRHFSFAGWCTSSSAHRPSDPMADAAIGLLRKAQKLKPQESKILVSNAINQFDRDEVKFLLSTNKALDI